LVKGKVFLGLSASIRKWFKGRLLLILLSIFLLIGIQDYVRYVGKIYPGVYIKDVHLAHKTQSEVERILNNLQMTFEGPGGSSRSLPLKEMGIELVPGQIISLSLQEGREHPWPLNCFDRVRIRKGVRVPLSYCIETKRLFGAIEGLKKSFERGAEKAYYNSKSAALIAEKMGYRMQEEEFAREIILNLEQKDVPPIIVVPMEKLTPDLTLEYLAGEGIVGGMTSFSTAFDASNINRSHNIALAAKELDQLIIAPGEIFSFNGLLGDTTPQKGYREGIIIQGGKYVAGYGGGICQVASTLYNVALLAGLQIVERHHHYFETGYVCPGRDATVFYGSRDLKFKNTCEHSILISTHVENGTITIAMAGTPLQKKIEIITRQRSLIEPNLRIEETCELGPGEMVRKEGSPGGRVDVWRAITHPDGERTEELLSIDNYMPYPAIIRKGVEPLFPGGQ